MLTTALLLSVVGLLSGLPGSTEAKECDKPCMNGQCNTATGNCVCFPGWVGDQCQHCGGRFRYSEHTHTLTHSHGGLEEAAGITQVCSLTCAQRSIIHNLSVETKQSSPEAGTLPPPPGSCQLLLRLISTGLTRLNVCKCPTQCCCAILVTCMLTSIKPPCHHLFPPQIC